MKVRHVLSLMTLICVYTCTCTHTTCYVVHTYTTCYVIYTYTTCYVIYTYTTCLLYIPTLHVCYIYLHYMLCYIYLHYVLCYSVVQLCFLHVDNIMNLLTHVATNVIFMCKEPLILSVNFKLFASLTRLR